MTNSAPRST